jgi:hypothetical protein
MIDRGLVAEAQQELAHVKQQSPQKITIGIPADHPKAEALRKLFDLLATEVRMPSGVVVSRTPVPGAEEEILNAIADFGVPVHDLIRRAGLDRPTKELTRDMGLGLLGALAGGMQPGSMKVISAITDALHKHTEESP